MSQTEVTYRYSIERSGGPTYDANAQEVQLIENMKLGWQGAEDVPEGLDFAQITFGGVDFTVWRTATEMTAEQVAALGIGLRYDEPGWWEHLAVKCDDWNQRWPEVDRDGRLTGRVIDDEEGFLNVNNEALISIEEARAGGWEIDRENGMASERA